MTLCFLTGTRGRTTITRSITLIFLVGTFAGTDLDALRVEALGACPKGCFVHAFGALGRFKSY